jgi:hypothetical protein
VSRGIAGTKSSLGTIPSFDGEIFSMKRTGAIVLVTALGCAGIGVVLFRMAGDQRRGAEARAQVDRWAEKLGGQTTDTGVYIRHAGEQLPEDDPWGTPLSVNYTGGGFAETLTVRSAGPDQVFHTDDDIVARRSVVNLKGVGKALKENVEEFAQQGSRGMAKGAVEGIKQGVQEALGKKKQQDKK